MVNESIKVFLNQYERFNEKLISVSKDDIETAHTWGVIHAIKSIENYIEQIEKDE